jgi:ribonuclease P protein component
MKASIKPLSLRNNQHFRRVYDQGYRFHTPFFSAFILRNDGGERRYGITVTRKIGGAVVRNRCKRRLREIIRKYDPQDSSLGGFDLVINVRAEMVEADFKQLQEAFSRMMDRFRDSLGKQVA